MLIHPQIDPVMLQLGPLHIHWYGFMYLLAFSSGWALGVYRARQPGSPYSPEQIGDLVFYVAIGAVLGGRIGYVLFYNLPVYLDDPLAIFKVWQGGMAFHGGLLGVLVAIWLFARTHQQSFWVSTDFLAPLIPSGLAFGRLGNFINGELWGAPTTVAWGMVFPHVDNLPRHPSQLYELALEGVLLFILLWWFSSKPRPVMAVSGLFLIGYGFFRFLVEFVRMPDAHIGYLAFGWLTTGHVLTLPMILFGMLLMGWAYRASAKDELK